MWAVTITVDADPDIDTLDAWEDRLEAYDATVARIPGAGVDITVYESGDDPVKAVGKAADAVQSVTGYTPHAIAIVTETERLVKGDAPSLPRLVSAPEVGEVLGVSRQRVYQLQSLPEFPEPLYRLRTGPVWDALAIERFVETWERRPGRPRSGVVNAKGVGPG